jgi:hypothetical protein
MPRGLSIFWFSWVLYVHNSVPLSPILHPIRLDNLSMKNNTAKYYFGEKSSFLHTFLKFFLNQGKFNSFIGVFLSKHLNAW